LPQLSRSSGIDARTLTIRTLMTWTDETLIRALARAHRWKRLLEEGKYRSAGKLAEAEGVTRSFVNRLLRLTLLAPDIQEGILDGRQPNGMQLEELTGLMPYAWEQQHQRFACP
jgi:hypothetical protein